MVHEEIKNPRFGKVIRFFRKNILLFISLLIAFCWPKFQSWLGLAMEVAFDGDRQAAASYSAWLPMGNPMSKLILTIAVYSVAFIVTWFSLKRTQPGLKEWAKDGFTKDFQELSPVCKHVIFAAFWLAQLFVFALIWLGAVNLA